MNRSARSVEGRLIETVAEVSSTNAELLSRLAAGRPCMEGDWLVADRQTAGRGRSGRAWFDGAGNFMGSTMAHLQAGDPPAATLALVAGLAAAEAVAPDPGDAGLRLKWPNDLTVGQAKLGGILLERQGDAVVVGIGINIVNAPHVTGRSTTCLAAIGREIARDMLAERLAATWAVALARWHCGEWPALRAAWLTRAHPPGTALGISRGAQGRLTGTFVGLADDGAALLRLADGSTHVIHAGEVELVGGETVGADAAGD